MRAVLYSILALKHARALRRTGSPRKMTKMRKMRKMRTAAQRAATRFRLKRKTRKMSAAQPRESASLSSPSRPTRRR
jgi:hypothetical protein